MIKAVGAKDVAECAKVIRKSFSTVANEFGFTDENAPTKSRIIAFIAILVMLICGGCGDVSEKAEVSPTAKVSPTAEVSPTVMEFSVNLGDKFAEYTEIETIYEVGEEYDTLTAAIAAPFDATEEDIYEHASEYIDEAVKNSEKLFIILLLYAENETYYKSGNSLIASVRWAPYADLANSRHVPFGVYRWHEVYVEEYTPCNMEYRLTEDEEALYASFQEKCNELSGKHMPCLLDLESLDEYPEDYFDTFVAAANELGVDTDTLASLTVKVARWRDTLNYGLYCGCG